MKAKKRQPDLMEHTRATVGFLNAGSNRGEQMYAFLSLFHPKMTHEAKLKLSRP